ncbi:DUF732 domain-containing protein [Mycobacterium sp. LTG2003]
MKTSIVGFAATTFAVIALAMATPAMADSDEQFLATLEAGGFSWPDDAAAQILINAAHGICADLESGVSAADVITEGADATGWTPTQTGFFLGAAAAQYCPQHLERAIAEAETLGG